MSAAEYIGSEVLLVSEPEQEPVRGWLSDIAADGTPVVCVYNRRGEFHYMDAAPEHILVMPDTVEPLFGFHRVDIITDEDDVKVCSIRVGDDMLAAAEEAGRELGGGFSEGISLFINEGLKASLRHAETNQGADTQSSPQPPQS